MRGTTWGNGHGVELLGGEVEGFERGKSWAGMDCGVVVGDCLGGYFHCRHGGDLVEDSECCQGGGHVFCYRHCLSVKKSEWFFR